MGGCTLLDEYYQYVAKGSPTGYYEFDAVLPLNCPYLCPDGTTPWYGYTMRGKYSCPAE